MRIETTETSVKLIERRETDGYWVVRWDFKPKLDSEGNETGIYEYQEEYYNWIPSIEDIQRTIVDWHNKQTDGIIKYGFWWKDRQVLLTDENKFNYCIFADRATKREDAIKKWDEEHPELAGINSTEHEVVNEMGNPIILHIPTGRPQSYLPITFKIGENNTPDSFYTFQTIDALNEFVDAGVDHLQASYGVGWYKIATFDWTPYIEALKEL